MYLEQLHSRIWFDIETRLSLPPQETVLGRVSHILPLFGELPLGIALSCAYTINKILTYVANLASWEELPDPRYDFSSILKDPRQWKHLGNVENEIHLGHNNPNFLYGIATCTYQDSGSENCPDSQWALWEKVKLPEENQSHASANLFGLYQTEGGRQMLINRLQELHVNSYRLSIEWSQIEPEEGKWNEVNLQVYVHLCKTLRDHGIQPMITLHHFSEPNWFHQKGSFENEENIDAFLNFAKKIFPHFTKTYNGSPLVQHVCTINEPAIDAFSRFIMGSFSPGLLCNFKRAAQYLKGALKAHCIAHEELKQIAPEVNIGITHQYLKFIPTNPLLFPVTHYFTRFINDIALKFFSEGKFTFQMPTLHIDEPNMPEPKTDFVGLQYYIRPMLGILGPTSAYGAPMTEMPFREDPEGLYEAIIETHKAYQAPIIVTENGISTHGETQRSRYITRALYAAQRAQEQIGEENLQGYHLWSFSDNLEWDMGMRPQAFGAFTLNGTLKEGAKIYSRLLLLWKQSCDSAQKTA